MATWTTQSWTAKEVLQAEQIAGHGIKIRWSPALVAKLAKVNENAPHRWQEEPQWLRLMPILTTWRDL